MGSSIFVRSVALGSFFSCALAFACGGDDSAPTSDTAQPDGGSDTGGSIPTGSDASQDAASDRRDAASTASTTVVTLVNAIADLGSASPLTSANGGTVLLCFDITNAVAPGSPSPSTRVGNVATVLGAPIGLAADVSPTDDLSTFRLTPYLFNSERLSARYPAGLPTCDALLHRRNDAGDGGALVTNLDYWRFQDILAGQLPQRKHVMIVATGCADDSTLSANECGAAFHTGAGTLNLRIFTLNSDGLMSHFGAQGFNAAPALANDTVAPVLVTTSSNDAGDMYTPLVPAPLPYPQTFLEDPTVTLPNLVGARFAYRAPTVGSDAGSDAGDAGPRGPVLTVPLADIATLSGFTTFFTGLNYTFVVLGNPSAAQPPLATRGLHYIAIQN